MTTLALDLAASTGVAWGIPFQSPTLETWKLRGKNRGERGLDLMGRLSALLRKETVSQVFIEKPMEPERLAKMDATGFGVIQLNGLVFLAETVCAALSI